MQIAELFFTCTVGRIQILFDKYCLVTQAVDLFKVP